MFSHAGRSHAWLTVAAMFALLLPLAGCGESSTTATPGAIAPPIKAAGWLQGEAPGNLSGKVVVVDFWAYWCGPCRMAAPELIEAHKTYLPQGVQFLGLTGEGQQALKESTAFLQETGIPWPNGYGAEETMKAYGVQYLPTVVVIDAKGRIAWSNHETRGITLTEAIDRALRAAS